MTLMKLTANQLIENIDKVVEASNEILIKAARLPKPI